MNVTLKFIIFSLLTASILESTDFTIAAYQLKTKGHWISYHASPTLTNDKAKAKKQKGKQDVNKEDQPT